MAWSIRQATCSSTVHCSPTLALHGMANQAWFDDTVAGIVTNATTVVLANMMTCHDMMTGLRFRFRFHGGGY